MRALKSCKMSMSSLPLQAASSCAEERITVATVPLCSCTGQGWGSGPRMGAPALHLLPKTSDRERRKWNVTDMLLLSPSCSLSHIHTYTHTHTHTRRHTCVHAPVYTPGEQNSREEHSLEGGEALLKGQIILRGLKRRQKKEAFLKGTRHRLREVESLQARETRGPFN